MAYKFVEAAIEQRRTQLIRQSKQQVNPMIKQILLDEEKALTKEYTQLLVDATQTPSIGGPTPAPPPKK